MKYVPEFPNYFIDRKGVVSGKAVKAQTLGKNGYYYVTLYHQNTSKKLYIHRLLASLYLPNPEGKRTVNHKDGVKTNNDLGNLEWATDSENIQHAHDTGLNKNRSKVDDDIRQSMFTRFMDGESMKSISEDYSFNNVTVSNHIRRYVEEFSMHAVYDRQVLKQRTTRGITNLEKVNGESE